MSVTVAKLYESLREELKLTWLNPSVSLERVIRSPEIHRPGLALAGYFEFFASNGVQILGRTETHFVKRMPLGRQSRNVKRFFSANVPCVVFSRNQPPPKGFLEQGTRRGVPVFRTPHTTERLFSRVVSFLEEAEAPETTFHGTFVDVYGVGILLLGKSGIGKSECALELVERGHRLVADDVVRVSLRSGSVLLGRGDQLIRHHLEVRGLGIIDVQAVFGVGVVRNQKRVRVVVTLERWSSRVEYDRLGMDEQTFSILGVPLPHLVIPVRPGRSIPILVEVAALNQRAKDMGIQSAQELDRKLIERMAQQPAGEA